MPVIDQITNLTETEQRRDLKKRLTYCDLCETETEEFHRCAVRKGHAGDHQCACGVMWGES